MAELVDLAAHRQASALRAADRQRLFVEMTEAFVAAYSAYAKAVTSGTAADAAAFLQAYEAHHALVNRWAAFDVGGTPGGAA